MLRIWKVFFEELLNEKNEKDHGNNKPEKIRMKVDQIGKDEVRKTQDVEWKVSWSR